LIADGSVETLIPGIRKPHPSINVQHRLSAMKFMDGPQLQQARAHPDGMQARPVSTASRYT
jgi:hypothetical protein